MVKVPRSNIGEREERTEVQGFHLVTLVLQRALKGLMVSACYLVNGTDEQA
jgi:hypothetical protein